MKTYPESIVRLMQVNISESDAFALRRAAMALHSWYELECGNGNDYGSWAIERDDNGDGPPFMVHHHYQHGRGKDYTTRQRIPDRETGARKRIDDIMTRYPQFVAYHQTDPRGAALSIVRLTDIPEGQSVECYYDRGTAVYR